MSRYYEMPPHGWWVPNAADDQAATIERLTADLAEARAEIQNLGKRESDYKELYQVERAYLAEARAANDRLAKLTKRLSRLLRMVDPTSHIITKAHVDWWKHRDAVLDNAKRGSAYKDSAA